MGRRKGIQPAKNPSRYADCDRDKCWYPAGVLVSQSSGDQTLPPPTYLDTVRFRMVWRSRYRFTSVCPRNTLSPFKQPFSRWIWVSRYQNVSILDFTGAKDDGGGDNRSYKTCKAPVISSPSTTNTQFFTGRMPFPASNQQCQITEGKSVLETTGCETSAV